MYDFTDMPSSAIFRPDIAIADIRPLKNNPRKSIKASVEGAIAQTIQAYKCLPPEYALLVRPLKEGGYEAISGNTRLKVAIAHELKTLPAWSREMTDDEAFYAAAESNSHGELSKLEYGFNGLLVPEGIGGRGKEGGLTEYARRIAVDPTTLRRWVRAAEVLQYLEVENIERFEGRISALDAIAKAERTFWQFLVDKTDEGISIAELSELITPKPEIKLVSGDSNIDSKPDSSASSKSSPSTDDNNLDEDEDYGEDEDDRDYGSNSQNDAERAIAAQITSAMSKVDADVETRSQATKNPMHLSISNEAYTPLEITESAKIVFGGEIDLDPASCAIAQESVGAKQFFAMEDDGTTQIWECDNFFVNPPGGKEKGESNQFLWFSKAEAEYLDGNAKQGIYLAFNDSLRAMAPSVHNYPICWIDASGNNCKFISGGRIRFDAIDENGDRKPQNSPTHSNFLVFFPPALNTLEAIQAFKSEFSKYGTVVIP